MTLSSQLKSTTSLLDATSAVRNWRALLLFGITLLLANLLFGLLAASGTPALALLGWLLAAVLAFYGFNAVGIMLMDDCRMGARTTIRDALRRALGSSHRVLGVALVALAGLLVLVVAVAVLLLICKIPLLGPLLFTVAMPVSVLVLGAAALALLYVCVPLTACAVWTGASVSQAVANLLAIVRRRLIPVILQEFVLTLIVAAASLVIGAVLTLGGSLTALLSGRILALPLALEPAALVGLGLGGSGYLLTGLIGGLLLLALAAIVPGLILIQGFCQIYLGATDSLVSELPPASGDDTLNTAARLRAAEEAAQSQREHRADAAPEPTAPADARIEPTGDPVAASTPAAGPATAPATEAVAAAQPQAPATPSAPPDADGPQRSLGFEPEPSAEATPTTPVAPSTPQQPR